MAEIKSKQLSDVETKAKDILGKELDLLAEVIVCTYNAWAMIRAGNEESDLAYAIDDIIEDAYPFQDTFKDTAVYVSEWARKAADAIRNL